MACSHCGKRLGIQPEWFGKDCKCPHCGLVVRAPALIPATAISMVGPAQPSLATISQPQIPPASAKLAATGDPAVTCDTAADAPVGRPATADSLQSAPSIPGYEVLGELGRGGMGVVYKARHVRLKRLVALKMILDAGAASGQLLQRFRAEAEAVARMQHPNIVQVHGVGECEGRPYLCLEFVEGGSLDRKLGGVPLPPQEAARLLQLLAHAVHAAHEAGIVHRDLKPANVLLTADGTPKVTDFGLAKHLDVEQGQTRSGAILGTPSYMAPEQALGNRKEVGPASDVYALGAILYECLTGRPPFKGASPMDTLVQLTTDEPVAPSRLQSRIPVDLETICLKCLEKSPRRRYATAAALDDELGRFLRGEPILARPLNFRQRSLKWAWRHPAVAGLNLLIVAIVVVSFGLIVSAWRSAAASAAAATQAAEEENEALGRQAARAAGEAKANAEAQRALASAEEQRRKAETYLYYSQFPRINDAYNKGQLVKVRELLAQCPKGARGWEWHFLDQGSTRDLSQQGHAATITGVAFSPDGARMASASEDRTVKVWDVATGRLLHDLRGYGAPVWCVAFSADGRLLASGSGDEGLGSEVKLWDLQSGREVHRFSRQVGYRWGVIGVAFSPDGRHLYTNSGNSIKRWDLDTEREDASFKGHAAAVLGLGLSSNGQRLVSAGQDETVRVWETATGQPQVVYRGHASRVHCAAFSPDRLRVASGAKDGAIHVWDADTGRRLLRLKGHYAAVLGVTFSPDGRRLASTSQDGTVRIWDAEGGMELLTLRGGHFGKRYFQDVAGNCISFSPDGRQLAAGGFQRLKVWEAPPLAARAAIVPAPGGRQ